eukprot:13733003-Ditylum_brightwellii.AAC.1
MSYRYLAQIGCDLHPASKASGFMCNRYVTRDLYHGDLISKLNADVKSLDFMDCPCNYNKTSRVNGECAYK